MSSYTMTKIVATLGPATSTKEKIRELLKAGVTMFRLNSSHGDVEMHKQNLTFIREIEKEEKTLIPVLLDLQGPKIRIGNLPESIEIKIGQVLKFRNQAEVTGDILPVDYKGMANDVTPGEMILIDDGKIQLKVQKTEDNVIYAEVLTDGLLKQRKGINIPGSQGSLDVLTARDLTFVEFAAHNDIDYLGLSFVREASDVVKLRELLEGHGNTTAKIISKIEKPQAVNNIDSIIEVSDGIMVARGDLGIEISTEKVPIVQKTIIRKANAKRKVVIVATQMLDSMIENPIPTRAETSDVANAILDGTDAIMLSGETAAGKYPVESVQTMVRIANRTEADIDYEKRFYHRGRHEKPDVTEAVCHATCTTAYDLNASAIVAVTKSGRTARMISRYRPACPVLGGTTSKRVWRQMAMSWGVCPILLDEKTDVFALFDHAVDKGKCSGLLKSGDLAVITSGVPIGISGTTNMLKVVNVE